MAKKKNAGRTGSKGSKGKTARTSKSYDTGKNGYRQTSVKNTAGHTGKKKKKRRRRRIGKIIFLILEILVILVLIAGLYIWSKLDELNRTTVDETSVGISEEIDEELVQGYTNIALFGLDTRDSDASLATGRSDTIMVVSINNDTSEIRMISVYRDTYLGIDDGEGNLSYKKANSAYASYGAEGAIRMLNQNLDLDITDYVTVDFYALVEVVDLMGGVELEITEAEAEVINKWIDATSEIVGVESSHISGAGTYVCDGVQATAYCRIRSTSGGDFTRAQRQRKVLAQLFKSARSSSLSTLNSVIDAVLPDVETSLSNAEILSLASRLVNYSLADTSGFPFDLTTATYDTVGSVDVPCTLATNVTQLYEFFFEEEDYEPSSTVQNISYTIIMNTGIYEDDAVDYGIEDDELADESETDTEE